MAITKKAVGTGVTAETRDFYSVEHLEESATKAFSAWTQAWEEGGGNYGAVTLQFVKLAELIREQYPEQFPARDSLAWFAQQVLRHHQIACAAQERGEVDNAMRFAFDLGAIVERWRMKCSWEDHALRGLKSVESGHKGADMVHGDKGKRDKRNAKIVEAVAAEIAKGIKKTAAYQIVGEEYRLSEKQVRRIYKP